MFGFSEAFIDPLIDSIGFSEAFADPLTDTIGFSDTFIDRASNGFSEPLMDF